MIRIVLAIVGLLSLSPVRGADDAARLEEANRALAEGLPQVAATELRELLSANPDPATRRDARLALARADLCAGNPAAALATLDNGGLRDAASQFWRARALAQLERWPEALAAYEIAEADRDLSDDARFARGEALAALGREGEAAGVFEKLAVHPRLGVRARLRQAAIALAGGRLGEAATLLVPPPGGPPKGAQEDAERTCLTGRLRLAQGRASLAEEIFANAVHRPAGLSQRVLVDDYRGWAQACLAQGQVGPAEDVLESFIGKYPRLSVMPAMFGWLESLYARQAPPDDLADLRRWSADAVEPARQALATLGLGRGERGAGRVDAAAELFANFGRKFPEHPLRSRALLELAAVRLGNSQPAEARSALEEARQLAAAGSGSSVANEIDALDARIQLAQGDQTGAARKFEALSARLETGGAAEQAAFNAVLAWSRANDPARLSAAELSFEARFPGSALAPEFPLEEALAEAAHTSIDDPTGRQRAAARLRSFIRDQPRHRRLPEVRIALAELNYMRLRPNLPAAWREISAPEIQRVQNDGGAGADRAEYLAIWLADTPGPAHDEEKAVALARDFLARRLDSPLAAEARMKLSEIYFRREDYSDAQTQLELLVQRAPGSPLAEQALYLAGLSAESSMSPAGLDKAVVLFESAASRNGPLKLSARLRQAEVQNRLERGRDALILYDGVIAATAGDNLAPGDLEARCTALAGRGETLFARAASDARQYAESAGAFDQLAKTSGASLAWRRLALTKKGRALEKAGDADAALVAYDQTLNAEAQPGETPRPEWTWFYRAGYDAAKLLEAREDWPAVVAIYKKLAAADGPSRAEFDALLRQRRLEHFIWDE